MNRIERTQLKKKYKKYIWLAYSMIGVFVMGFVTLIILDAPQPLRAIGGIAIIIAIFAGLIFNVIADWTRRDLMRFKADVREYRTRRFFLICMDLIKEGKLREAGDVYTDFIPVGHRTRDYLYSVLIQEFSKSTDPELRERGEKHIAKLREFYNPDKVIL